MINFLKKIIIYFRSVNVYVSKKKLKFKLPRYYKFRIVRSFSGIDSKELKNYFENHIEKKKRFSKGYLFLTLIYKKKLVSSGWLFSGNSWNIEEINQNISIKKKLLIFDFFTTPYERGKGHYTNLLKIIRKKFQDKEIIIYALSSNLKSKRAIVSAGFKFKHNLKNFL